MATVVRGEAPQALELEVPARDGAVTALDSLDRVRAEAHRLRLSGRDDRDRTRQLGVAWIAGGGASVAAMLKLTDGIYLVVAYLLITALDDIGAYFTGTRFGKHKMAPSISPAKSWEGWIGGFVSSLAGGLLFAFLLNILDPLDGLAIGAISGLLAPVGDLIESMAKREIGIKDSGRLLPGHGGLLDRLDAILFCAPAVYLYVRFVVV